MRRTVFCPNRDLLSQKNAVSAGRRRRFRGFSAELLDSLEHVLDDLLGVDGRAAVHRALFLVPKVLINADGALGERNAASCGSIS